MHIKRNYQKIMKQIAKTKPLDLAEQGFAAKPDNILDTINYSKCYHNCLVSVEKKFSTFIRKVRDKRLTESLELIEQSGFTGDLALFILGEIAACGVCDE